MSPSGFPYVGPPLVRLFFPPFFPFFSPLVLTRQARSDGAAASPPPHLSLGPVRTCPPTTPCSVPSPSPTGVCPPRPGARVGCAHLPLFSIHLDDVGVEIPSKVIRRRLHGVVPRQRPPCCSMARVGAFPDTSASALADQWVGNDPRVSATRGRFRLRFFPGVPTPFCIAECSHG